MATTSEATEVVSTVQAVEDTIYVAVGSEVEDSKPTLFWAFQNFPGKKICLLHVHQRLKMINFGGGSFPASRLEESELRKLIEIERQILQKTMGDYISICQQQGVKVEKLHVVMDDVGEGIVELIFQHGIKKLVMGAAANKHYTDRMTDLRSKKALYVHQLVPPSCQIWFICNGHLIHKVDEDLNGVGVEATSLSRSRSINESAQSSPRISPPGSGALTCSSSEVGGDSARILCERTESSEWDAESLALLQLEEEEDLHVATPTVLEGSGNEQLYDQLEQAMAEAEKFKREAFEESVRRGKAEKTALEATRRVRELESLYNKELKHRIEVEEVLAKEKEEHEKMMNRQDEQRLVAMDQKLLLEVQVASSDHIMMELNDKIYSSEELLKFLKKERDELEVERDNAVRVTEELLKKQAEDASSVHMPQFFSEFSFSEINEATSNFDPSLKIGEGRNGSLYKGLLHHTPVAIKVLNAERIQSLSDFQQEVDVLNKLRHPNLVTLIGTCPDTYVLIYEYLPNGNLSDRLSCKDNAPPLTWQSRIRIATELCSALIFLHSSNPHRMVHGNLKAQNILLDANLVCKLNNVGIVRAPPLGETSNNMTPNDTYPYQDPQFHNAGELSPKSDVYSFGIVLLQLLTGRSASGLANEMRVVIDQGNLSTFLDPSAGDWPFVQANQLAHLALRCCETNQSYRPDLVSGVWRVLEPMRTSCRTTYSSGLGPNEHQRPPSYFICPIFQEVMKDPHVAADGFTYEAEALKAWLDGGHETSPMTNLRLDHFNLVPNRALRSAIQEWLQQH